MIHETTENLSFLELHRQLLLLTKHKTPPWAPLMERKRTFSRDTWSLINQNVREVLILTGLFVRTQRGGGESSQNPQESTQLPSGAEGPPVSYQQPSPPRQHQK